MSEFIMVQSFLSSSSQPRRWLRATLLCGALVVASTHVAVAQSAQQSSVEEDLPSRGTTNVSPEVAQKAAAIARQTMSPFCPGRTLSDCPSEYATAWRRDIRAMVALGMSADEIQRELESRVGENLSGSPNRSASYSVSIGLALGAALVLFFVLSRLRLNSQANKAGTLGGNEPAQKGDAATESLGKKSSTSARTDIASAGAAASPVTLVDDQRLESELLAANGDDD